MRLGPVAAHDTHTLSGVVDSDRHAVGHCAQMPLALQQLGLAELRERGARRIAQLIRLAPHVVELCFSVRELLGRCCSNFLSLSGLAAGSLHDMPH